MAKLLTRKAQIAAKEESVEGTAETLAAADADIRVYEPTLTDDFSQFDRDFARSTLDTSTSIVGTKKRSFGFTTDFTGGGTATTAPNINHLLKACGYAETAIDSLTIGTITTGPFQHGETITGGTSGATARVIGNVYDGTTTLYIETLTGTFTGGGETVTGGTSTASAATSAGEVAAGFEYKTASSGFPSLTMGLYNDGMRFLGAGGRGNVTITATVGEPVRANWEFDTVYQSVTDTALLTGITYESTIPPAFLATSLTMQVGSTSDTLVYSTLEFNTGNDVQMREDANSTNGLLSALIVRRGPTGTIDPELELVATKDWYTEWTTPTENYIEFTVGSTAGNQIRWIAGAGQITQIGKGDRAGIATAPLNLQYNGTLDTGDDSISILFI